MIFPISKVRRLVPHTKRIPQNPLVLCLCIKKYVFSMNYHNLFHLLGSPRFCSFFFWNQINTRRNVLPWWKLDTFLSLSSKGRHVCPFNHVIPALCDSLTQIYTENASTNFLIFLIFHQWNCKKIITSWFFLFQK